MIMNTFKTLQEKYKELDMRLDICINSNSYGFDICLYDNITGRFATCIEVDEEDVIAFTDELYKKLRPVVGIDAMFNFGVALTCLRNGSRVARKGWNGKGIYIELQKPDENSKMTLPYIYMVTNGLITDNPAAPKGVVPWLASQTDLLADDWYIAEK